MKALAAVLKGLVVGILSLLLFSCGSFSGGGNPGGDGGGGGGGGFTPVRPVGEVAGRIVNWSPELSLKAYIGPMVDSAVSYGVITVSTDGTFTYRLPVPRGENLSEPLGVILGNPGDCQISKYPTLEPQDSRAAFLYLIANDRYLVQLIGSDNMSLGAYVYFTKPTRIQGLLTGRCGGNSISFSYDIRAPQGWSYLEARYTSPYSGVGSSKDGPSAGFSWRIMR